MNTIVQRLCFIGVLLVLTLGLARFVQMRFQSGDVYPAYSTFRADPVGAKALFASLEKLMGSKVRRNFESIETLSPASTSSLVFLGASPGSMELADGGMTNLVRVGARAVLAVDARESRTAPREEDRAKSPFPLPPERRETKRAERVGFERQLGFDLKLIDPVRAEKSELSAVLDMELKDLPATMPWFGRYYLEPKHDDWQVVYSVKDKPVVLWRKIGLGSLVAFADSFPFSNEALQGGHSAELLLWALRPERDVIFDETHLGVRQGRGVAVLMREYRLHGLLAGALLVACLWIWRTSSPLVPLIASNEVHEAAIAGKTARAGIVHLLRRNIPAANVLQEGLRLWAGAGLQAREPASENFQQAKAVADAYSQHAKQSDLAATYRLISNLLFRKENKSTDEHKPGAN